MRGQGNISVQSSSLAAESRFRGAFQGAEIAHGTTVHLRPEAMKPSLALSQLSRFDVSIPLPGISVILALMSLQARHSKVRKTIGLT